MSSSIKKYLTGAHLCLERVLVVALMAGIFLPFIHLGTSSHNHYFNLVDNEFYDIIPVSNNDSQNNTAQMASGSYALSQLNGTESVTCQAPIRSVLKYCLTSNGILFSQNNIATAHAAAIDHPFFEPVPYFEQTHMARGFILSFAPKNSPPSFC